MKVDFEVQTLSGKECKHVGGRDDFFVLLKLDNLGQKYANSKITKGIWGSDQTGWSSQGPS